MPIRGSSSAEFMRKHSRNLYLGMRAADALHRRATERDQRNHWER